MHRFEEKLSVTIERWGVREGKTQPEWIHKVSGIFDPEEEKEVWVYFDSCLVSLEKGQRLRLYWYKYGFSPPTELMKKMARSIERNSNPVGAKVKITALAGEIRHTLESMVIADGEPDEEELASSLAARIRNRAGWV